MRRFSNLSIPRKAREDDEGMLPEFEEELLGFRCTVSVFSGGAKDEELGSGSAYDGTRRWEEKKLEPLLRFERKKDEGERDMVESCT